MDCSMLDTSASSPVVLGQRDYRRAERRGRLYGLSIGVSQGPMHAHGRQVTHVPSSSLLVACAMLAVTNPCSSAIRAYFTRSFGILLREGPLVRAMTDAAAFPA